MRKVFKLAIKQLYKQFLEQAWCINPIQNYVKNYTEAIKSQCLYDLPNSFYIIHSFNGNTGRI